MSTDSGFSLSAIGGVLAGAAALVTAVVGVVEFWRGDGGDPPTRSAEAADTVAVTVEFDFLGVGGCRSKSGGPGQYDLFRPASFEDCKSYCAKNEKCNGIEYNTVKDSCEVHYDPMIMKVTSEDVSTGNTKCYLIRR